jgi:hypothetical protein
MLHFIYRAEYPGTLALSEYWATNPLVLHIKMYDLGDLYRIEPLKIFAKKMFEQFIDSDFKLETFHKVIEVVYSSRHASDRELRDLVSRKIDENFENVWALKVLRKVILENEDLKQDLLHLKDTRNKAEQLAATACKSITVSELSLDSS